MPTVGGERKDSRRRRMKRREGTPVRGGMVVVVGDMLVAVGVVVGGRS